MRDDATFRQHVAKEIAKTPESINEQAPNILSTCYGALFIH